MPPHGRDPPDTTAGDEPTGGFVSSGRRVALDSFTGVSVLVFTKGLDVATTLLALSLLPWTREGNPFVVAVAEGVGIVPGLLLVSGFGVLGIALATETLVDLVEDDGATDLLRLVGYGPTSAAFLLFAVHNALVLVTGRSVVA